ncbi:MAG: alanine--tRNA ligase [SAR202 cluster bacterium]|nr:alanine--tRNA ligase [SAR202 cluster bacterium]
MNGDQIRDSFIKFFESKGHQHMPSASLIPAGDPTLLFTSAGMVPFKPFFMGEQTPPSKRLTSSQKSFRTTDIDEVGDHKHLTFFEMLGNFSIGDYFKEEAVGFCWELVTELFKLDPQRLYVTIHLDDEEAFAIWRDQIGVPLDRIYRYGDKDNWWGPAGNEGPTGPCSEVHYDGGLEKGCHNGKMMPPDALTAQFRKELATGESLPIDGCHPNCDCERFVELWNLVFMQYYQDSQRNRTPLPAPSVDTGMGLERAAVILQGKNNIYETDLFVPIIDRVCEITGTEYGANTETDYALRVVAEHARAAAFLIADGVIPSNDSRGHVLRRIIRRAMYYELRLLRLAVPFPRESSREVESVNDFFSTLQHFDREKKIRVKEYSEGSSFLIPVIESVVDHMGLVYEDLQRQQGFITDTIRREEQQFFRTLTSGEQLLREILAFRGGASELWEVAVEPKKSVLEYVEIDSKRRNKVVDELTLPIIHSYLDRGEKPPKVLSGVEAFLLHDTYGFSIELTKEIARQEDFEVDEESFDREMEAQKAQSRSSGSFSGGMDMKTSYSDLGLGSSEFVGYSLTEQESKIAAILVSPSTGSGRAESVDHATQGQQVEIVISQSPFYAEGGGQLGDRGAIRGPNGVVLVEDTQSPVAGLIVQRGSVQQGDITVGETVTAQVEIERRLDSSRNHSGTHILHAALRSVLGPHVRQAGSLCAPERLRFDFSHVSALTRDELLSVQSMANEKVRGNLTVTSHETSYSEAVREGALAFFGDRYGDVVRVVTMANGDSANKGAFSVEVCGGTHVAATGQVGTLVVLGESSIGGGMRRIEAVTGRAAVELFQQQSDRLEAISQKLQTPVADLEARLDSFIGENDGLRKQLEGFQKTSLRGEAEELLGKVQDVDGVKVVAGLTSAGSADGMREMADFLRDKLGSVVVALAAVVEGSPILITMVTPDLVKRGLHAGNIARDTAKVMGGGGGGRPEMAQAGGKQPEKVDEALGGVPALVRQALS